MRLHRTTLCGIGPFRDIATLDLDALPGKLTAVRGVNGAGKSTLLAAGILGAAYSRIPRLGGRSAKSLRDLAVRSDAYVESTYTVAGCGTITIRQSMGLTDAPGTALVLDANGKPHPDLQGTSVKAFGRWAARKLPPLDVMLSGPILTQQHSGLLHLSPSERKGVVLRAVGAERLEAMAKRASDNGAEADGRLREIAAAMAATRDGVQELDATSVAVSEATRCAVTAKATLAAAAMALQAAEEHARCVGALQVAERRLAGLVAARSDAEATVAGRVAVMDRVDTAKRLDATIARHGAAARTAREAAAAAQREARRSQAEHGAAVARKDATAKRYAVERARLLGAEQAALEAVATADKRLANNRSLLAKADEIRAAVAQLAEVDAQDAALQEQVTAAKRDGVVACGDLRALRDDVQRMDDRATELAQRRAMLADRVKGRAEVEAAVAALPARRQSAAQATAGVQAAHDGVAALRDAMANHWQQRHVPLRGHVQRMASASDPAGYHVRAAREALAADDAAAREAEAMPSRLAAAVDSAALLGAEATAKADVVRALEGVAARAPEMERDAAYLADTEREIAALVTARAGASRRMDEAEERRAAAATRAQVANEGIAHLRAGRAALAELARFASNLSVAEERIAELTAARDVELARAAEARDALHALPQREDADIAPDVEAAHHASVRVANESNRAAQLTALAQHEANEEAAARASRAALGDVDGMLADLAAADGALATLQPQIDAAMAEVDEARAQVAGGDALDVAAARVEHDAAEAACRGAQDAVVRAEEAHAAARRCAQRLATLHTRRAAEERELAEWTALAADLGRNGLQADLIDAATPELTATSNDLIHASLGPRWTVEFRTCRENAEGRTVEGFEIRVTDNATGRASDANDWCGGETALIGNAVADAVAILACRRLGMEAPTIVRDESDAALGSENFAAWVAMLRRTVAIVGASKMLVITHKPAVAALCDAVVEVRDGAVHVL